MFAGLSNGMLAIQVTVMMGTTYVTIPQPLQLYSGTEPDESKLIATLCGHDATANDVYNSTDNTMLVVMRTDFSDSLKGFQAEYATDCTTTIEVTDDNSGVIRSDALSRFNQPTCTITFSAKEPDQHVVLTFLDYYNNHTLCESSITVSKTPPIPSLESTHSIHIWTPATNRSTRAHRT